MCTHRDGAVQAPAQFKAAFEQGARARHRLRGAQAWPPPRSNGELSLVEGGGELPQAIGRAGGELASPTIEKAAAPSSRRLRSLDCRPSEGPEPHWQVEDPQVFA